MNIGEASKATGVSVKMIRYYESIGLIPAAVRTLSGYRVYRDIDIRTLQFIRRARGLGFSVEQMQQLIELWRNQNRSSAAVKTVALEHVRELEAKIAEMESMARALRHLAGSCHGDAKPDCPILDDLMAGEPTPARKVSQPRFDGVATVSRNMKPQLRAASAVRQGSAVRRPA